METEVGLAECELFVVSDPKKCTGCHSCMLTCSLVHEGIAQHSSARILIAEDRLGGFPGDITIGTCRQCVDPACVRACRVGALVIDPDHFNVRVVDEAACTGCKRCIQACHFSPSRVRFDLSRKKAMKCDLCRDTRHWAHEKGELACVEVCPVHALAAVPSPGLGLGGFEVNLRGPGWAQLDLPTD